MDIKAVCSRPDIIFPEHSKKYIKKALEEYKKKAHSALELILEQLRQGNYDCLNARLGGYSDHSFNITIYWERVANRYSNPFFRVENKIPSCTVFYWGVDYIGVSITLEGEDLQLVYSFLQVLRKQMIKDLKEAYGCLPLEYPGMSTRLYAVENYIKSLEEMDDDLLDTLNNFLHSHPKYEYQLEDIETGMGEALSK